MRAEVTTDEIINLWLEKYHGVTIEQVAKDNPDRVKAEDSLWFYMTYAVIQEQHDEWYEAAIELIAKRKRLSKKYVKKHFTFDYLNTAPSVIHKTGDVPTN